MAAIRYRTVEVEGIRIFYREAGANAFKHDLPNAQVRFLDAGHFAIETHGDEIAAAMTDFLSANVSSAVA